MFSDDQPTKYRTNNTYATTFTGPVGPDPRTFDKARNEAMAQASYQGDTRQFDTGVGKGIAAGTKMQAFRSGLMGDAQAGKAYAQAQQEQLGKFSAQSGANLQFQERLSGERGWVRDLLMDRDENLTKERMSGYKRYVDVNLGDYERKIKEAVAAQRRETELLGGLI